MQRCTHVNGSLSWFPDLTVSPVVGLDLLLPLVANWQVFWYLSLSHTYGHFNTCLLNFLPARHQVLLNTNCQSPLTYISTLYAHAPVSPVAGVQKYGPVIVPFQLLVVVFLGSFECVQMILVSYNLTIYIYVSFPNVFYRFYIKQSLNFSIRNSCFWHETWHLFNRAWLLL